MNEKRPTIGLLNGSFMSAWCWDIVRKQLEARGYDSVAVNVHGDDPDATASDRADMVVSQLKGEDTLVLVGHSSGADVMVRAAGSLPVTKLVGLCPSFHKDTLTALHKTAQPTPIPRKNFKEYDDGLEVLPNGLTVINRTVAEHRLFNDIPDPQLKNEALDRLQPQRRAAEEPVLERWPEVPMTYVIGLGDLAITWAYSQYEAHDIFGLVPKYVGGDHTPQLSVPGEVTELIVNESK